MSSEKKEAILRREALEEKIKAALDGAPEEYVEVLMPVLASLVGLTQIATAGRVESVADLLAMDGDIISNLMESDKGLLLGYLEAQALAATMEPVDPTSKLTHNTKIQYMKLLKELIAYEEVRKTTRSIETLSRAATTDAEVFDNPLLQEVVGAVEGSGQEEDPPDDS
jgi:hypothetical protein